MTDPLDPAMTTAAPVASAGRKPIILVIVILVIVAAWTGGWFWLRGEVGRRMDAALAGLATRGLSVECPDRQIGGWPFRIDVDCTGPRLSQAGKGTLSVGRVRVTALVYQPSKVLFEFDGPLNATGPAGEVLKADWSLMQASLTLALSQPIEPLQLSVAADGLVVDMAKSEVPTIKLTATHAEVHGRPAPDGTPGFRDIDLAASLKVATLSMADRKIGPDGTDIALQLVARRLPGEPVAGVPFVKAWAGNDGRVDVTAATLSLGDFAITGRGAVSAEADGQLTGNIRLIASGIAGLMAPGATSMKGRAELMGLATAFTLFGKQAQDGAISGRSLDLTISKGRVKVGPTVMGQVPPLF